ncbi:MAG: hypothetical protein ABIT76_04060 [Chthoniobacterales bacterium]
MAKSTSSSFWNHSVEKIEEVLHLRKQIDLLQAKLSKLVDGTVEAITPTKTKRRKTGGRKAKAAIAPKSEPVKKAKTRKKGGMTPEAKAKISAAMKARWEAKRNAAA